MSTFKTSQTKRNLHFFQPSGSWPIDKTQGNIHPAVGLLVQYFMVAFLSFVSLSTIASASGTKHLSDAVNCMTSRSAST
jgi:hypothetical protein